MCCTFGIIIYLIIIYCLHQFKKCDICCHTFNKYVLPFLYDGSLKSYSYNTYYNNNNHTYHYNVYSNHNNNNNHNHSVSVKSYLFKSNVDRLDPYIYIEGWKQELLIYGYANNMDENYFIPHVIIALIWEYYGNLYKFQQKQAINVLKIDYNHL